jgi:hypothetical protein
MARIDALPDVVALPPIVNVAPVLDVVGVTVKDVILSAIVAA